MSPAFLFSLLCIFVKLSISTPVAACGLIALFSCAAHAESNVSVYGRIDTAVESIKTGHDRVAGVNNSGSYFGFQGVEDLGQGLRAGFVLESAFNSDDGAISNPNFFGNRSELFIEGRLGRVRMGSFFNPSYYVVADATNLHNEDYGITADALYAGVENATNRLSYTAPTWNGLTVEGSVSLHERAADSNQKNAYDLAATYERGNWTAGAGYSRWADAKQAGLQLRWSEGPWTVAGYHQRSQGWDTANFAVNAADGKRNVTRVAVAYAIGAGELHADFGHANGPASQQAQQWTVGYNHHLSKRTKLYAFYSVVRNENGASYATGEADVDRKAISVGLRHHF